MTTANVADEPLGCRIDPPDDSCVVEDVARDANVRQSLLDVAADFQASRHQGSVAESRSQASSLSFRTARAGRVNAVRPIDPIVSSTALPPAPTMAQTARPRCRSSHAAGDGQEHRQGNGAPLCRREPARARVPAQRLVGPSASLSRSRFVYHGATALHPPGSRLASGRSTVQALPAADRAASRYRRCRRQRRQPLTEVASAVDRAVSRWLPCGEAALAVTLRRRHDRRSVDADCGSSRFRRRSRTSAASGAFASFWPSCADRRSRSTPEPRSSRTATSATSSTRSRRARRTSSSTARRPVARSGPATPSVRSRCSSRAGAPPASWPGRRCACCRSSTRTSSGSCDAASPSSERALRRLGGERLAPVALRQSTRKTSQLPIGPCSTPSWLEDRSATGRRARRRARGRRDGGRGSARAPAATRAATSSVVSPSPHRPRTASGNLSAISVSVRPSQLPKFFSRRSRSTCDLEPVAAATASRRLARARRGRSSRRRPAARREASASALGLRESRRR